MRLERVRNAFQRRRTFYVLIVIVIFVLLGMIARQPDQWQHPYIWAEDGNVNLPDFAAHGWASLLHPHTGYFLLPTKLIFALAATLSFRWFPEISYWLTLIFTASVLLAIALSPTALRLRLACAIAPLFLPIGPEVYAISVLSLWWGSLLVALPLFWQNNDDQHPGWRVFFIVFGGLSSPFVIFLLPLYALKTIFFRQRSNLIDLLFAGLMATIQLASIVVSGQSKTTAISDFSISTFLYKFFGFFIYLTPHDQDHRLALIACSTLVFGVLIGFGIRHRRELGTAYFFLLACFLLSAVASILRVSVNVIHPQLAGPRYFFLPFVFLSWAVLQLAALPSKLPQLAATAVLVLSARSTIDVGQRRSESLDWRLNISQCVSQDEYELPIHTTGKISDIWHVQLRGETCRRLLEESWFK